MKLVLNIVEKAPQLAGLEPIEKSKNKRLIIDDKCLSNTHNLTARDKKVMKKVLIKIKLIKTKI